MRWLAQTVVIAWLAAGLVYLPAAQAAGEAPVKSQSASVTDYLHAHRLPLVGAQVLLNPDGSRQVMLYGFTATEFGKQDAAAKTRRFLHDPELQITNRIKVRPELANMKAPAPRAEAAARPAAPANSDVNGYLNQQARDQQQYLQQQQSQYMNQGSSSSTASMLATVVPLLGLGAAIMGLGIGGGTTFGGVGTYGGYSGYGGMPMNGYGYPGYYNQYPGMVPYTAPAPYPGYGTPYGAYP